MKKIKILAMILVCQFLLNSPSIASSVVVGAVKTFKPNATISQGATHNDVTVGSVVYEGDVIVTDSNGSVGIIVDDGSVLTIGPNSRIIFEQYKFSPETREVLFTPHLFKGSVIYTSGAINRIAPGSVKFKTPMATLTLRGTKVLIKVQ